MFLGGIDLVELKNNEIASFDGFNEVDSDKIKNIGDFNAALIEIPYCRARNFRIAIERLEGDISIESGGIILDEIKYWRAVSFKKNGGEIRIFIPYLKSNEFKESVKIYVKNNTEAEIERFIGNITKELKNTGELN